MFVLLVPLWTEDFWESGLQIVKPHIIIFVIDTHISVVPSNWSAEGRGLDSSTGFPLKTILHKGFGLWGQVTISFFFFFYDSDILKNKSSKQAGSLLFDVVKIPYWSCDL